MRNLGVDTLKRIAKAKRTTWVGAIEWGDTEVCRLQLTGDPWQVLDHPHNVEAFKAMTRAVLHSTSYTGPIEVYQEEDYGNIYCDDAHGELIVVFQPEEALPGAAADEDDDD